MQRRASKRRVAPDNAHPFRPGDACGASQDLGRAHRQNSKGAREQGWSTLLNGDLLHAAEKEKFDVLLTTDTSIPYRQNLQGRKLAIVILNRNKWSLVRSRAQQIADAIEAAKPGTCTLVEIPAK